jgi:hypothetical protein
MRVVLLLAWAASASAFAFTPSALSTRSLPAMAVAGRPARLALRQGSSAARMMGPGAAQTEFPSGKEMPFTLEMRNAAMALHTFSQAPKSGKVKDTSANTQVPPHLGPRFGGHRKRRDKGRIPRTLCPLGSSAHQ